MSSNITIDGNEVINNLNGLQDRVKQGLTELADATGQRMKSYGQTSARWTDRTGDARRELNYEVKWEGTILDIAFYHGMDYGVFLELCNSEKYAILQEARDSQVEAFKRAIIAMNI